MHKLPIIFAILLALTYPASALGVLKIEAPSSATAGEEVQIRVINSLTNEPVQGVTVYVNGVKIGATDENGIVRYIFSSPGVYVIGATKLGYTPALDVSISVEEISTPVLTPTPVPTEVPTPEFEEVRLEGLVIDYFKLTSTFENLTHKKVPDLPIVGVMVNETSITLLFGHERLKTGNYIITGYRAGTIVKDEEISLVIITDYRKLDVNYVPFSQLRANPEKYSIKLIRTSANLTELGFLFVYRNIQVGIGTLTSEQMDPISFARQVLRDVRDFEKDPDPSKARRLFGKFSGVPTVRFGHDKVYWKFGEADVTGFVITKEMFKNWAIVNYELDNLTLSEYVPDMGFYIIYSEIKSKNVDIDGIWNGKYNGDVVSIEVTGYGYDVSVKQAIASTLSASGAGAVVVEASPIDILLTGEMVWAPIIPNNEKDLIFSVGASSYEPQMLDVAKPVEDIGTVVRLTGLIVSAKQFNDTLPNIPLLLIYDKEPVRSIQPGEISEDLQDYINEKTAQLEDVLIGVNRHKTANETSSQHETPEPQKTHEVETPTSENNKQVDIGVNKTPGFELLVGIFGLIGAIILRRGENG